MIEKSRRRGASELQQRERVERERGELGRKKVDLRNPERERREQFAPLGAGTLTNPFPGARPDGSIHLEDRNVPPGVIADRARGTGAPIDLSGGKDAGRQAALVESVAGRPSERSLWRKDLTKEQQRFRSFSKMVVASLEPGKAQSPVEAFLRESGQKVPARMSATAFARNVAVFHRLNDELFDHWSDFREVRRGWEDGAGYMVFGREELTEFEQWAKGAMSSVDRAWGASASGWIEAFRMSVRAARQEASDLVHLTEARDNQIEIID